MNKYIYICALAASALLVACEQKTETVAPAASPSTSDTTTTTTASSPATSDTTTTTTESSPSASP